MPVTLKEAKEHWKSTKSLLTKEARAAFRRGEHWTINRRGYPIVFSDDRIYAIGFAKRDNHHIFGYEAYVYDPVWIPRGVKEWRPR